MENKYINSYIDRGHHNNVKAYIHRNKITICGNISLCYIKNK